MPINVIQHMFDGEHRAPQGANVSSSKRHLEDAIALEPPLRWEMAYLALKRYRR